MTELLISQHAKTAIEERAIDLVWVRRVVLDPEWEAPDPIEGRIRRFGAVAEREGRVLRVVCAGW
ncbi:MAG: DUF4258 domain-containing protein [Hyphomicrobiales bacterium]|nr:MAG: DUF4258 domain-containing protein [Hyphomicrobiales bacterium]